MNSRFAQLETDLARRLAPILRDLPTLLFEELVNLIATMQYERESTRYPNLLRDSDDESEIVGGALSDSPAADG